MLSEESVKKDMLIIIFVILCTIVTDSRQNECPDCCTCQEDKAGIRLSCKCIPLVIPDRTTQFVLRETPFDFPGRKLNFYHPSWQNLKYLYLHGNNRDISITNMTFLAVPNLVELHMVGYYGLTSIPGGAFSHMQKLKVLDLSRNNHLCLKCLSSLLHDLQNLSVETLNLSRTNGYARGLSITDLNPEFIKKLLSVKNLDISWTGRIIVDLEGIEEAEIRHLRYPKIEIFNSSETFFTYSNLKFTELFNSMILNLNLVFPNMKMFVYKGMNMGGPPVLTKPKCSEDLSDFQYSVFCKTSKQIAFLPPLLEFVNIDDSLLMSGQCLEKRQRNTICVSPKNKLKTISAKNLGIIGVNIVIRLDSLNSLDFRNNKISVFTDSSLRYFPNLKNLLLGDNELWKYQYNASFEGFLKYSTELQILDLSNNKLSDIPRHLFDNNDKLEIIDLSDNQLDTLSFKFTHLQKLITLDMSTNKIITLSESNMNDLKSLVLKVNLSLDLSHNKLICSCRSKQFIENLKGFSNYLANFEQYKCLHGGEIVKLNTIDRNILQNDCIMAIIVVVLPVSGSLILIVLLGILIYRKRIVFTKLYVSCRFWRYRNKLVNVEDRVFLAYSHHDKELVLSRIYPELNRKLQQLLRSDNDVLYINDKDFAFPGLIDEEIVTAVLSCKCTLVLISREFLKSGWTNLEVSCSWTKKRPIFIVLLEDITENELHGILKHLYNKDVRLHWPKLESEEKTFWTNLLKGLIKILDSGRKKIDSEIDRVLKDEQELIQA